MKSRLMLQLCFLAAIVNVAAADGFPEAKTILYPAEVREALEKATSVELLSLNYKIAGVEARKKHPGEFFDGLLVLGSVQLKDAEQKKLVAAFHQSVTNWDGAIGCFSPRHGIRVKHAGSTYDLVICFECITVVVNKDGKHFATALLKNPPADLFNQFLKDAKVPLPEQPEPEADE
ncbi:hypothetical protein ETAA8_07460 [Anatilimnocola aggregata]|uniref:Uncharacterized protein n=1 Tax=Anatilimnocola aggregata TaxID=2528021 RepID=A0A517Y633_9BACT|nr:hypothetical protein [Anatilimnocola aggregata]QDU25676.1 hypothetical protein ETAA8_07460 [Anatilimnocola aggregata]